MSEPTPGGTDREPLPPPPSSQPGVPATSTPELQEDRTYAVFVHLSSLVLLLLGPLVMWLVRKDRSSFVDHHGKEAVNFQITVAIAALAIGVILRLPIIGCFARLLPTALVVAVIVCVIIAAVNASNGLRWRYPVSLRLIR